MSEGRPGTVSWHPEDDGRVRSTSILHVTVPARTDIDDVKPDTRARPPLAPMGNGFLPHATIPGELPG